MDGSFTGERKTEESSSRTNETSRRISLKSRRRLNYPIWKDKLKENCYKRVREDRNRLIWNMRLPGSQSHYQKIALKLHDINNCDMGLIKSAFEEILSDEMEKIKDIPRHSLETPISSSDFDEMLWEYDGLHNPYQGDCEEILLEMQKIFYDDLGTDTTAEDNQIETWKDEEDEFLARLVHENMKLNSEQEHKQVWCPICKQGELLENQRLIYCSLCEIQLNKDAEVNLHILQDRLAEVHVEHFDSGCKSKPKFCIQTRFNLRALYISCDSCNTFEIVL